MLRSLFARVAAFKDYSLVYEERSDGLYCFVRTWDDANLQDVCVRVESLGQQVPNAELSCLSRVVDSLSSCQWQLAIQGGSPTLHRVLSDNRVDGRRFIFCREFTEEVFLKCYREADHEIFGMLEMTSMVDFLMLRLRGALHEPWMEDVVELRRCVIAGRVAFAELCGVVSDLFSVWESVREYVRYTGPVELQTQPERVSFFVFLDCVGEVLVLGCRLCELGWAFRGFCNVSCVQLCDLVCSCCRCVESTGLCSQRILMSCAWVCFVIFWSCVSFFGRVCWCSLP